jgi:general secretion pathway protein G
LFKDDMGRYPTEAEGLKALATNPGDADGWLGPYLKSEKSLNDPWGHPLVYTIASDGSVSVTSLGADNKPGGSGVDADISQSVK